MQKIFKNKLPLLSKECSEFSKMIRIKCDNEKSQKAADIWQIITKGITKNRN